MYRKQARINYPVSLNRDLKTYSFAFFLIIVQVASLFNVLFQHPANATTNTITKNAGSCISVAGAGSAWTTPNYATITDGQSATARLNSATSQHLRCSNYNFGLPDGVEVVGIATHATYMSSKPGQNTNISLMKNGTLAGSAKASTVNWPTAFQQMNYGGATDLWNTQWSVLDVNNAGFGVSMYVTSSANGNTKHDVDNLSISVTYAFKDPVLTQSNYQWFVNSDSVSVGAPLNDALQNTPTNSPIASGIFRLRMLVRADTNPALSNSMNFKLQFAERGSDNVCDTSFVGESYQDVTPASKIAYADNATPTDGQVIMHSNLPTDGARPVILQEYNESGNTGIITNIQPGESGLWDFVLKDLADVYGAHYCFRMVYNSGQTFMTYLQIPEISTTAGIVSVGFVSPSGSAVTRPKFAFSPVSSIPSCQQSTGMFGGSDSGYLRVSTVGNSGSGWGVAIAPTDGAVSLWSNGSDGKYYDHNDGSGSPPGCASGSDGDIFAGQLQMSLGGASIVPSPGCSSNGVTLGHANSSFTASTGALSIMSATSSTQSSCYFELSGASFTQTIPANQPPGNYSINMTVTVTSL